MIDIEKEVAELVQGWALNDMNDPHAREALEGRIVTLCRRVAAEQLEDAAKVCDALADESSTQRGWRMACECAAAIRTRKEQEGR